MRITIVQTGLSRQMPSWFFVDPDAPESAQEVSRSRAVRQFFHPVAVMDTYGTFRLLDMLPMDQLAELYMWSNRHRKQH